MSINLKEHSVTCDFCGTSHIDLNQSCSSLREELHEDGWSTSVPAWAFHSPAMQPAAVLQKYPTLKRKTVDTCPACEQKHLDKVGEVMNGVSSYTPGLPAELKFRFGIETGALQ